MLPGGNRTGLGAMTEILLGCRATLRWRTGAGQPERPRVRSDAAWGLPPGGEPGGPAHSRLHTQSVAAGSRSGNRDSILSRVLRVGLGEAPAEVAHGPRAPRARRSTGCGAGRRARARARAGGGVRRIVLLDAPGGGRLAALAGDRPPALAGRGAGLAAT